MDKSRVLRIIDANLNRASEGLRVCEDITRFILDDTAFTRRLKFIRHKIFSIAAGTKISKGLLCRYRDIETDCGKKFSSLEARKDWQSVFFANIQRVKESLRALEEFFKLFDYKAATGFKALRFEIYEFEKKITAKNKALSGSKCNAKDKALVF